MNIDNEWDGLDAITPEEYKRQQKNAQQNIDDEWEGLDAITPEEYQRQQLSSQNQTENTYQYQDNFQQPEPTNNTTNQQADNKNPVLSWVSREITKPAYKSVASIPDFPVIFGNLLISAINKFGGTNIPQGKLPSEYVGKAVDKLSGGYSEGEPKFLGKAVEFAGSFASGGGIGKVLKETGAIAPKIADKVSPWLGGTKSKDIATMGAIGGATDLAEQSGASPLVASGVGLATGMTPAVVGATRKKVGKSLTDQSMINQDKKVIEASQRQDIILPRVSMDRKNEITKKIQTVGEHSIISAGALQKQKKEVNKSIYNAFERNMDKTSVKPTTKNREQMEQLYKESKGMLQNTDVIHPENTFKSISNARNSLKELGITNSMQEGMVNKLEKTLGMQQLEKLKNVKGSVPLEAYKEAQRSGEVTVKQLLAKKEQLNRFIDKMPSSEYELTKPLIEIRDALKNDIKNFADNNPKFAEKYYSAEKLYADRSNRQKLHDDLKFKEYTDVGLDFKPKTIADNFKNVMADKDKEKAFLRRIGGKENLKHWEDIITSIKALPETAVSTLAKNMKIMSLIGVLAGAGGSVLSGGGATMGIVTGVSASLATDYLVSKFLTSPKLLQRLVKFSKNPNDQNAKIVNNTFKAKTGVSVRQFMAQLDKEQSSD